VIHRMRIAVWSTGIIFWCVFCAVWLSVGTHEDYARLAAARACYPAVGQSAAQCAGVKPEDIVYYKAAIDRKARISRLGAAFGALVVVISLIITRRRAMNA
jgi:hypothetical protein